MERTEKHAEFEFELVKLINRLSMENASNTPDYVLAQYLTNCLISYEGTASKIVNWEQITHLDTPKNS